MKNIADIRVDYSKKSLNLNDLVSNPIEQFNKWFQEALESKVIEPSAMNLATASTEGKPSGRIVLLKGVEQNGFIFFTNYQSDKGNQLLKNPQAALTFFWPELERQVRIEGSVAKTPTTESDKYFSSRPRESQIGAWSSPQSQEISGRSVIEKNQEETEKKFTNSVVERPKHWGGYILKPDLVEFWQGRPSRLHDRILYKKNGDSWALSRLAP